MDIEKGSQKLKGVRVDQLTLSRGERRLFSELCVSLSAGQALALTGANGAGKTSFLRAVAGFIRPDSGQIEGFDDQQFANRLDDVRQHIHLLGHLEGLKPTRTARQELMFQVLYLGGNEDSARSAIEALNLEPLLDLETRKLSAGQKRRLSFARLLGAPRALWLLDEPLAPLDDLWRTRMAEIMQNHLAAGGMIIAAIHDPLPVPALSLDLGGR